MSCSKSDWTGPDRPGRLEVLGSGSCGRAPKHGLVGRKLQSLFSPPETLPESFLVLLEELDRLGARQEPDPA